MLPGPLSTASAVRLPRTLACEWEGILSAKPQNESGMTPGEGESGDDDGHTILLISDGTCRTCEQVVKAVLVQFGQVDLKLEKRTEVRDAETVRRIIDEAAREGALVFYTLVAEETRDAIREAAQHQMVPIVDLLGPVLVGLYDLYKRTPQAQPGILHKTSKAHVDRIDSVEYTLDHDDGRGLHELVHADVVLVGVSRVSKSTTCFYLAYSGIRAANVPLFADSEPPKELRELDPRRVIGLTANPYRLQSVRESRIQQWALNPDDGYGDRMEIAKELRAASEQMAKHGWRIIDTSYKAIEEIAREVRMTLEEIGIRLDDRQPTADK